MTGREESRQRARKHPFLHHPSESHVADGGKASCTTKRTHTKSAPPRHGPNLPQTTLRPSRAAHWAARQHLDNKKHATIRRAERPSEPNECHDLPSVRAGGGLGGVRSVKAAKKPAHADCKHRTRARLEVKAADEREALQVSVSIIKSKDDMRTAPHPRCIAGRAGHGIGGSHA